MRICFKRNGNLETTEDLIGLSEIQMKMFTWFNEIYLKDPKNSNPLIFCYIHPFECCCEDEEKKCESHPDFGVLEGYSFSDMNYHYSDRKDVLFLRTK